MRHPKTILPIIISSSLMMMVGCKDNHYSFSGQFVDSPVEGLVYECTNGNRGQTLSNGLFHLTSASQCTFYLSNIILGTSYVTDSHPIITPYQIVKDTTSVKNIAALLQSLDIDGDEKNGISLPKDLPTLSKELLIVNDNGSFSRLLKNAVPSLKNIVTFEQALQHLNQTVSSYPSGTFKPIDSDNSQDNLPDENIPPNDGGGDITPPNDGGGDITPPNDGGGDITPPNDGGGDTTPPNDGGGDTTPPNDGDTVIPSEPINHLPVIKSIKIESIKVGVNFSFQVKVYDHENDPLTYELINNPKWLSINKEGILSGTPKDTDIKETEVTVKVSDGIGFATQKFIISVIQSEPTPTPDPTINYGFTLKSNGVGIVGAECDGVLSQAGGYLDLTYTNHDFPAMISCSISGEPLAEFAKNQLLPKMRSDIEQLSLDLNNSNLTQSELINISSLLLAIDSDRNLETDINLNDKAYNLYRINHSDALTKSQSDFKTNIDIINDFDTSNKKPGHTVDIIPAVTAGGSDDVSSSSGFVNVTAETAYEYVPVDIEPEISHLLLNGEPVSGINYYGPTYSGKTNEKGEFSYNWGENVSFSIETLTLGKVRAKGIDVDLRALSDDPTRSMNIVTLIKQLDLDHQPAWKIEDRIRTRFLQESNNIVELINLSLRNGQKPIIADANNWGPYPTNITNEFMAQFKPGGSAYQILNDLNLTILPDIVTYNNSAPLLSASDELKIMLGQNNNGSPVNKFHVFVSQKDGYHLPSPLAANFVNISNSGSPIISPRTDSSSDISFGGLAITDKFGRPFPNLLNDPIKSPTYIDKKNQTIWNNRNYHLEDTWQESSYYINKDTATFGLPFVVSGKIGKGRVIVLGNTLYNSILVSPFNYSNAAKQSVGTEKVDSEDMFNFFKNTFTWLANKPTQLNIGTNRESVYFAQRSGTKVEPFDLSPAYKKLGWVLDRNVSTSSLNPDTMPIYLLQAYDVLNDNPDTPTYELRSDVDIDGLISYISQGGNVVIMETLAKRTLPGLGKLLDVAGIGATGKTNGVGAQKKLRDTFSTEPNNVASTPISNRPVYTNDVYIVESLKSESDPSQTPTFENPPEKGYAFSPSENAYSWGPKSAESKTIIRGLFRMNGKTEEELQAWKAKMKEYYHVKECTNSDYDYELDCIEKRKGNGIPLSRTSYPGANDMVALYKTLPMSPVVSDAMISAANMGTNLEDLYQHELYYRTKGTKGVRLNGVDVERIYGNLSAWLWNNYEYRVENGKDEFGHKRVVEILNCYSNNQYGNPTVSSISIQCPAELERELKDNHFITSNGELNPSYPLNYMEKPFTRILLGRSYFDANLKERGISVDTSMNSKGVGYPGKATFGPPPQSMTIYRGSRQSTGVWVQPRKTVQITGLDSNDHVMVAMSDDLTGRTQHEMALNRPPRVSTTFTGTQAATGFEVPYGGLVYITLANNGAKEKTISFSGDMLLAPTYKLDSATTGSWITSLDASDAPLTEIIGNRFIYTTPTQGLKGHSDEEILTMAKQLDLFAIGANEFYGRDETQGIHQMYTDSSKPYTNIRLVDDKQISIGAAHSGYPVMVDRFPSSKSDLMNASTSWLVGHEFGHNLVSSWFNVDGAGETANNLLALYAQDRNEGYMGRIANTITLASNYAKTDPHPWANGSNADRLNFFGQLKIWAESHFKISDWESKERLEQSRSIYVKTVNGQYDEGWNFIKLVHRKAREGKLVNGKINYCSNEYQKASNLTNEGMLLVCSSYLTKTDLTNFFETWNVGEAKQTINFEDYYFGGVKTDTNVKSTMDRLYKQGLISKGSNSPLEINQVPERHDMFEPQEPYWN
ncbi:SslE/AcfD family lipoprotein zinc metalloprotease [Photobacterium damselae]|uniref:SslE/AcfD family lipoprotein zinc metalloprotease n=4 Tax=Photobacterium damselae TaxID=38293 RepID=UPI0040677CE9